MRIGMSRPSSFVSRLRVLGLLIVTLGPANTVQGAVRPNIVIILADDSGQQISSNRQNCNNQERLSQPLESDSAVHRKDLASSNSMT